MQKRILIVEDEEMIRSTLSKKLKKENFEVKEAEDGESALSYAIKEKPDIILLDITLPGINGMEVMRKIRESGKWGKNVPIVILTNLDANSKIIEGVLRDAPSYYTVKANTSLDLVIEKVKSCLH